MTGRGRNDPRPVIARRVALWQSWLLCHGRWIASFLAMTDAMTDGAWAR
jgi:hypothetical protein